MESLKQFLIEKLKVRPEDISFVKTGTPWYIMVQDIRLFKISFMDDHFCCGITHAGETTWAVNRFSSQDLPQLAILLMDWLALEARQTVESLKWNKGLLTWSHTNECWITDVLKSTQGENTNWKLVSEFFNPNSGNVVSVFHCNISDDINHTEEYDDDDDDDDDNDDEEYMFDDEEYDVEQL